MQTFIATLSPMLMMFLCMVIGFLLNKKRICPDNTVTVLSKLETYVLSPALILKTFSENCTVQALQINYRLVLFSLLSVVLAITLAYLLSPFFAEKGYTRNVYKYALAFANSSFMGNAIVPAILGDDALFLYMLFTVPLNVGIYTWGLAVLIPREKKGNPLKNLINPPMLAVVLGAALGLTGAAGYLPSFVKQTMSGLGGCMGPIAMVLTGFVIGNYSFKTLLSDKKVYIASLLRLFVIPAGFLLVLKLLGADSMTLTLCLFAYATPLGLNTVVFPAAYGGDPAIGASMAMVSHTACVVTIPLMYVLLTSIMG